MECARSAFISFDFVVHVDLDFAMCQPEHWSSFFSRPSFFSWPSFFRRGRLFFVVAVLFRGRLGLSWPWFAVVAMWAFSASLQGHARVVIRFPRAARVLAVLIGCVWTCHFSVLWCAWNERFNGHLQRAAVTSRRQALGSTNPTPERALRVYDPKILSLVAR